MPVSLAADIHDASSINVHLIKRSCGFAIDQTTPVHPDGHSILGVDQSCSLVHFRMTTEAGVPSMVRQTHRRH